MLLVLKLQSFANNRPESGLLIFTLLDGDLARQNCYLEVLMDDHVFPSYSSNKVKTRHHEFNESMFITNPIECNY